MKSESESILEPITRKLERHSSVDYISNRTVSKSYLSIETYSFVTSSSTRSGSLSRGFPTPPPYIIKFNFEN